MTKLPNIGKVLAAKLNKIGIFTLAALAEMGSVEAVLRIGDADESTCCSMLFAIEGAIRGIRWHGIPKDERERLKEEFKCARLSP